MALQFRRGSDAERQSVTFQAGEPVFVLDTKKLYVGDGSTVGGISVVTDISDDTSPSLGGNLNLNGNDIVGTGNINIDGTITATGNINLGDGAEDNVIVGGQIGSNLIPKTNAAYDLGAASTYWKDIYATGGIIQNQLTVGSILTDGDIAKSDSTIIYNGTTGALTVASVSATSITAGSVTSDLIGSVFADDSSILVDSVNNLLVGDIDNTNTTTNNLVSAVVTIEGTRDIDSLKAGLIMLTDGNVDDPYDLFTIKGAKDDATGPGIIFTRGRGTDPAAPTASTTGDEIMGIYYVGYDSSDVPAVCSQVVVTATGTIGSGIVPGKYDIKTANATGALVSGLTIDHEQVIEVADNTIGIDSGSGTAAIAAGPTEALKIIVDGTEYALPLYGLVP